MEERDSFCFPKNTKNPNPSPIEKRFGFSILTVVLPVDIPTGWEPRAKQQPTGLIACGAMRRRPVQVLLSAPNHENPNLFSIEEGFGFLFSLENRMNPLIQSKKVLDLIIRKHDSQP